MRFGQVHVLWELMLYAGIVLVALASRSLL